MRVIIYDNDISSMEQLMLQMASMPINTLIDKVSDIDDFISLFERHQYDTIVVDVDDEIGKKILDRVLLQNPKQKVITIGTTIDCLNNCDQCMQDYQKIRLVKPITDNDLFYALHNIAFCHQYCLSSSSIVKLKHIDTQLNSFEFDLQHKAFINKNNFLHGRRDEELDILTSMLEYEGFTYNIDNAKNIFVEI